MSSEIQSIARAGDRLFAAVQRILPTRLLSWLMFKLTRIETVWFKNVFIRIFMRQFKISLAEAAIGHVEGFRSFNDFFTRALKPGARAVAPEPAFVCPVDGTISQLGPILDGRIFQAKGHDYSAVELFGGDALTAQEFADGEFCTIYLAPYNYHRIHMPADARLRHWRYVPGRLFSVNPATARAMPGLFARNERVIAMFDTDKGPLAMVLVGALFVGSIETVWAGQISPPHKRSSEGGNFVAPSPVALARGEEMGRFNMGSTVILLTAPGMVRWDGIALPGTTVRMGQALGR
ncbi:MAG: archaetidylserine decarboxylase [Stenotrophobium sp.]